MGPHALAFSQLMPILWWEELNSFLHVQAFQQPVLCVPWAETAVPVCPLAEASEAAGTMSARAANAAMNIESLKVTPSVAYT